MLACSSAWGGDFDAALAAVKKAWPDKTQVVVLCDSAAAKGALAALASAAGGMKIMVLDVKSPQDVGKCMGVLASKKPDLVVLIPGDRNVGDGTPGATFLIQRVAALKVPVVGTTEAAVKQGAVVAAGPGTGGKVLTNPKAAALVGVGVPEGTPVN